MASFTRQEALDYHRRGRPGKIQVTPTKPLDSQLHLSLAYSPGISTTAPGRLMKAQAHMPSALNPPATSQRIGALAHLGATGVAERLSLGLGYADVDRAALSV